MGAPHQSWAGAMQEGQQWGCTARGTTTAALSAETTTRSAQHTCKAQHTALHWVPIEPSDISRAAELQSQCRPHANSALFLQIGSLRFHTSEQQHTGRAHYLPLRPQRPFKWVLFSVVFFFPNHNRTKMISQDQIQIRCHAFGAGSSFLWSLRLRTAISSDGAAPPVPFRAPERPSADIGFPDPQQVQPTTSEQVLRCAVLKRSLRNTEVDCTRTGQNNPTTSTCPKVTDTAL